jgi:serine/threonine protein phosphatase 1
MVSRSFVIGDIHGCSATLRRMVEVVIGLTMDDQLYLLGDLIDRGPDTKGVLDFIFELKEQGFAVSAVRGNHEDMFLLSCENQSGVALWGLNGGWATLESFSAAGPTDIPSRYRQYLQKLPYYLVLDEFIIVHAGMNFEVPDPFSDTESMLWTRSPLVDLNRTGGRRLICGHTPVSRPDIEASLQADKIMLDNGCVFEPRAGMGSLAALELNSLSLYFQENIDS